MLAEYDLDPREFTIDPAPSIPAAPPPSSTRACRPRSAWSTARLLLRHHGVLAQAARPDLGDQHVGCIGQAVPTAIGAAVARRGARRWRWSTATWPTIMHARRSLIRPPGLGVKLLIAVFNDEALGAEYQKFVSKKMDAEASVIRTPDLGAVARALAAVARSARPSTRSGGRVDEFMAGDGPMLLDIRPAQRRQRSAQPAWFGEDV